MSEVCAPLLQVYADRRALLVRFAGRPRGQQRPCEVTFDWRAVYRLEDRSGLVRGFFHTHPDGLARPSATDAKTMRGWSKALGKPLLCVIQSGERLGAWEYAPSGAVRAMQAAAAGGLILAVFPRAGA